MIKKRLYGLHMMTEEEIEQLHWKYIYVIEDYPHFKIGYATNVTARLKTIQNANPRKLTKVIYVKVPNAEQLEAELHEKYKDYRVRGEWFELNNDLVAELVAKLKAMGVNNE